MVKIEISPNKEHSLNDLTAMFMTLKSFCEDNHSSVRVEFDEDVIDDIINYLYKLSELSEPVSAICETYVRPVYGSQGELLDGDCKVEYVCPKCGATVGLEEDELDNYCYNCGAKIEGVED